MKIKDFKSFELFWTKLMIDFNLFNNDRIF